MYVANRLIRMIITSDYERCLVRDMRYDTKTIGSTVSMLSELTSL